MAITTHTVKEYPRIAAIAARVGYRKHKFMLHDATSAALSGTYWDGGSRSEYRKATADGRVERLSAPTAPPQFNGGVGAPTIEIESGALVIETGIFCGKPATMMVVGRAADALQ